MVVVAPTLGVMCSNFRPPAPRHSLQAVACPPERQSKKEHSCSPSRRRGTAEGKSQFETPPLLLAAANIEKREKRGVNKN